MSVILSKSFPFLVRVAMVIVSAVGIHLVLNGVEWGFRRIGLLKPAVEK